MQDERIVALYWERNESAISETDKKYGRRLFNIAYNILSEREDSLESVNDTYVKTWYSIPPARPNLLFPYISKIIRNLCIDRIRQKRRKKRGESEYTASLSELSDCVSAGNTTELHVDARALGETLNRFLKGLSSEERGLFIERYFYFNSLREAAENYRMSESKAKSMLARIRKRLKAYLEQEGYVL